MRCAVELSRPILPKYVISYAPGIWMYPLDGITNLSIDGTECVYDGIAGESVTMIASVRNDLSDMIPVSSISELIETPDSYFYTLDLEPTKMLLLNIGSGGIGRQHYLGKSIVIGLIEGYISDVDDSREDGVYYNDIFYDTRVSKIPGISLRRDHLFYGAVQYASGSCSLNNSDGQLDDKDYLGSIIKIYGVPDGADRSAWGLMYTGVISSVNVGDEYQLNFTDPRTQLDTDLVPGEITIGTDTKLIPVGYNQITKQSIVPIEETDTHVTFAVCAGKGSAIGGSVDTARGVAHYPRSIDRIYMRSSDDTAWVYYEENQIRTVDDADGSETIVPVTGLLSKNLYRGTVTILIDYAMNGDEYEEMVADYFGWHSIGTDPALTGGEIILDMLIMFGAVQYSAANFDLQQLSVELLKIKTESRKVSYSITERKKLMDIITDIAYSCDMLVPVLSDGRIAMRVDTKTTTVRYIIPHSSNLKELSESTDLRDVVTATRITYGSGDPKPVYQDTSNDATLAKRWRLHNTYEHETCLTDIESVKAKSDAILEQSNEPRKQTEWQIALDTENMLLDVVDAVIASRDRNGNRAVYDIVSINKMPLEGIITIRGAQRYTLDQEEDYIQGTLLGNAFLGDAQYIITGYTA